MKRFLKHALRTVSRSIQPVLPSESVTGRNREFPVFCLGPSPIQWHQLFSEQTSSLVHQFDRLCRKGSPLKREIEEVVWKLKRARQAAMEEVNQTRIQFERRSVALLNAMTISPSGSQILYWGGPTLLGSWRLKAHTLFSQSHHPTSFHPPYEPIGFFHRLFQEFSMLWRFFTLCFLFLPSIWMAPLALRLGWGRVLWIECVRWTIENAGPAFIKWGQWGATRPDLLPIDLCHALERLHTNAPKHDFKHTRLEIERSFGMPLEELFIEFDPTPIASGSIAQVHKAKLNAAAAAASRLPIGTSVAVKVRHPGVQIQMERDFALMVRLCEASSKLPFFSEMRLEESMRQFGAPLREQLDLRLEAQNLIRFQRNFRRWKSVHFPRPLFPWISSSVLIESFEEGDLISKWVQEPDRVTSVQISETGLDAYLKMLTRDNFLHADLHPGNILVQNTTPSWTRWKSKTPKLVLLDAGMVAELTLQDQKHILNFFGALTRIDGVDVAQTILDMAVHPKCPNPQAFREDMKILFDGLDYDTIRLSTQDIIQNMLDKVRKHEVTLKGSVCTLMATTLVLEGWSTKLNPDISIMDRLRTTLPKPWNERFAQAINSIENERHWLTI